MAKKKAKSTVELEAPAPRNHAAAALTDPRYRKQVVRNKRAYSRKGKQDPKARLNKGDALAA